MAICRGRIGKAGEKDALLVPENGEGQGFVDGVVVFVAVFGFWCGCCTRCGVVGGCERRCGA